MTSSRGSSNRISHILKALLVLIFPLRFSGENLLDLLLFGSTGFLYTPVYTYPEIMNQYTWIMYSGSIMLRNFMIGMLIIFPGILFSHKLSNAPLENNYWKRGVGTAAGIYFLSIVLMIMFSLTLFNPYSSSYDLGYYQLLDNLRFFPTLVIGIFIVLPMVQRQGVIIGSPKYFHHYSMADLESNPKLSLNRERIISVILWIFLCFGPFAIGINYYYSIPAISPLMSYIYSIDSGIYASRYTLTGNFIDFSFFPFIASFCAFQFIFVRDVYRYIRKEITRQRLVSMAVFSIFAPQLLMSLIGFPMGFYYSQLFPLPLLQAIGFIVIRYHQPKDHQIERIWEDVPQKLWWEKSVEHPIPIVTTPERPIRHRDEELLTIPLPYLVLSKLRSLNHRRK